MTREREGNRRGRNRAMKRMRAKVKKAEEKKGADRPQRGNP